MLNFYDQLPTKIYVLTNITQESEISGRLFWNSIHLAAWLLNNFQEIYKLTVYGPKACFVTASNNQTVTVLEIGRGPSIITPTFTGSVSRRPCNYLPDYWAVITLKPGKSLADLARFGLEKIGSDGNLSFLEASRAEANHYRSIDNIGISRTFINR